MNIKELQLNINEHKQLFIGWFWQQVLKREQVSNPFWVVAFLGTKFPNGLTLVRQITAQLRTELYKNGCRDLYLWEVDVRARNRSEIKVSWVLTAVKFDFIISNHKVNWHRFDIQQCKYERLTWQPCSTADVFSFSGCLLLLLEIFAKIFHDEISDYLKVS